MVVSGQDIERTCESVGHTLLRPGCSAAFSISSNNININTNTTANSSTPTTGTSHTNNNNSSGSEQLIYVAELTSDIANLPKTNNATNTNNNITMINANNSNTTHPALVNLFLNLQAEVTKTHGVNLSVIILIAPRSINKTTSGKIARQWVKKSYLLGESSDYLIHFFVLPKC